MHYEIDNWAFNPGSIEVTNIAEFREKRGVFLVDVGEDNSISARHLDEYRYRPFQRVPFSVDGFADTKDLTEAALETVSREVHRAEAGKPSPIVEIILKGQLGFPNSVLELAEIRERAREITGALHIRIKNNSVPVDYAIAADIEEDASREQLERRVVEDLIVRDNRYKTSVSDISEAVIGAKRLALSDEEPEKIAEFIAQKVRSSEFQL
jgi:DNA repair exonuclease SbcCD nuclease subunit